MGTQQTFQKAILSCRSRTVTVFDRPGVVECHRKEGDTMNEQQNLREELFPNGMPEPEEFILTVAAYILANRPENPDCSEATDKENRA